MTHKEGEVVKVTTAGKIFIGFLFCVEPKYEIYTDYDGRETNKDLLYYRYIVLTVGEKGFGWEEFRSNDLSYQIDVVAKPEILMMVSVDGAYKEVKCATFEELFTVRRAYDLAGIKYKIYCRIC